MPSAVKYLSPKLWKYYISDRMFNVFGPKPSVGELKQVFIVCFVPQRVTCLVMRSLWPHQQVVICLTGPYRELWDAGNWGSCREEWGGKEKELISFSIFQGNYAAVEHCLFSSKPWASSREDQNSLHIDSL